MKTDKMQTILGLKGLDFTGYAVPAHTQEMIHNYVFNRYMPGSFGRAILAGDLHTAMQRADGANFFALKITDRWIRDTLPEEMRGSYEIVDQWCDTRDAT